MKNKTNLLITYFMIILILSSVFLICIPQSKADLLDIYRNNSIIEITYDAKAANDPFLPIDMIKEINATLNYSIDGYLAKYIAQTQTYSTNEVYIDLSIISTPKWCSATISPDFIKIIPTVEGIEENFTIIIKVEKNANANAIGLISLEATARNMKAVLGATYQTNISFRPGFLPILKVNVLDNTAKKVNPLDTTKFHLEIENLGNAKTLVTSRVIDLPKGWIASIEENTVIGSPTTGKSTKKTLSLIVRPPFELGYHNDREIIQIGLTPSYFDDQTLAGEEYLVSFIVHSKGFSTPGFEFIFSITAILVMVYFARYKKGLK